MPIYEYRCRACGKVSSLFTRSIGSPLEAVCCQCQSRDVARLMSSFAMGKTVQSVHENSPTGAGAPPLDYYNDPRNIGRHVEESFSRFGVEMPQSVRDTIKAAREGELPKGLDT
mgnify:CR=1 FL=1